LYDIAFVRNINAISPWSYRFLDTGLQISSCGPSLALAILNERSNRPFTDFNDLRQRVQDISDAHVQSLQNAGFYVEMIAAVCEQTNRGHGTK
jgi:predicted nucleic acid-binding OB-fold protein